MEAVTQISIAMPNVPSSLAKVGDKLRAANVNIVAITCTEGHPHTIINLVVDDPETAKIVLRELGTVTSHTVVGVELKNKPGAIASVARECAAAGINIHNFYTSISGKEGIAYVDTDNAEQALQLIKEWKKSTGH
jgi:hypothetical protein